MNYGVGILLVLSLAAVGACSLEPLDSGASGDAGGGSSSESTLVVTGDKPDSSWAQCQSPSCDNPNGSIPLLTSFPPIYLPDGGTTTNPCNEIEGESMQIREADCAVCHSASDMGGYNWVLNDAMLITNKVGASGAALVIPGDPADSLLYQKVSAGLDTTNADGMPPVPPVTAAIVTPRPSVSDVSVLYQWIMCLGSDGGTSSSTVVDYGSTEGGVASEDATVDATSASTSDAGGAGDATADSTSPVDSGVVSTPTPDASTAPPPTNLITNGNFSDGTTKWAVLTGGVNDEIEDGDLCVEVAAANDTETIVLGWPEPAGSAGVPLTATGSYVFSYTAHTTRANLTINATVGDTVAPNFLPVDFESKTDPVTTAATTFTHPFTPASGADPSAGISFTFLSTVAQSVCFANVSLVQN